jgi:hypothetical protein
MGGTKKKEWQVDTTAGNWEEDEKGEGGGKEKGGQKGRRKGEGFYFCILRSTTFRSLLGYIFSF